MTIDDSFNLTHFPVPKGNGLLKSLWEEEKMLWTIFSFPHIAFYISQTAFSCPRIDRLGHIVLLVSVCLSVRLSVPSENLTCELNIFLKLPYYSSYNAHIPYAGSFLQYPTSEGHIIKVKVNFLTLILKTYLKNLTCELNIFL